MKESVIGQSGIRKVINKISWIMRSPFSQKMGGAGFILSSFALFKI
jgi:hypothetical protein